MFFHYCETPCFIQGRTVIWCTLLYAFRQQMRRQDYQSNGYKYSPLALNIFMNIISKMLELGYIFKWPSRCDFFYILPKDINIHLLVSLSAPISRKPSLLTTNKLHVFLTAVMFGSHVWFRHDDE
jgi:hypothetical protein